MFPRLEPLTTSDDESEVTHTIDGNSVSETNIHHVRSTILCLSGGITGYLK